MPVSQARACLVFHIPITLMIHGTHLGKCFILNLALIQLILLFGEESGRTRVVSNLVFNVPTYPHSMYINFHMGLTLSKNRTKQFFCNVIVVVSMENIPYRLPDLDTWPPLGGA